MEDAPSHSPGLGPSLRHLKDACLGLAEDRIALVKVELQEEKYRLIQTFIWISGAIVSGMLAMTFGSLTLFYLFHETAPLAVLGGLAGLYAAAVILIVVGFRRLVSKYPKPFANEPEKSPDARAVLEDDGDQALR
ncbi:MAG: hypothetical protein JWM88_223 [Verrucomicrobia bacterium]|nr:hypothetical protein [Verrucomicrobiota bacterium]